MSLQARKFLHLPFALILALIAVILGTFPSRVEVADPLSPEPGYYNSDGTLNLQEKTSASRFAQVDGTEVQRDPEHGPIFSPKGRESLSSLATLTLGHRSALDRKRAGTDEALSHPTYPNMFNIVVSRIDVYGSSFPKAWISGVPAP